MVVGVRVCVFVCLLVLVGWLVGWLVRSFVRSFVRLVCLVCWLVGVVSWLCSTLVFLRCFLCFLIVFVLFVAFILGFGIGDGESFLFSPTAEHFGVLAQTDSGRPIGSRCHNCWQQDGRFVSFFWHLFLGSNGGPKGKTLLSPKHCEGFPVQSFVA